METTLRPRYATAAGARLLYVMPNHVNPTGMYVPRARREALVAWSHDASVPILEDDYAADLVLDDVPRDPPLRAMLGLLQQAFMMNTKQRPGQLMHPPPIGHAVQATILPHALWAETQGNAGPTRCCW